MLLIRKKTLGTASSDYFAQFQHLEHKRMACIHWYVTVQIEPFLAGGAVFDIHTARELCVESSGKHLVLFVGGCVHWAQTHICCIQCPSRIVHRHRHHCRPTDPSASRNQLTHRQELWRRKNTENRRTPRPRYFAHSDGNYDGVCAIGKNTHKMAVTMRRHWFDDDFALRHRDSWWAREDWFDDWKDWPADWPRPRDLMSRFWRDTDHWWRDWPSDWPRMDAVMPRFTSHLDRLDRNWRNDPFWLDIYPRWAEPIFKEGIDVHSNIINDERRFAVEVDCYQFKPEEIQVGKHSVTHPCNQLENRSAEVQVKTQDDTLMIEGRHEDVRDRDNFTKMYFVRKYQMPHDVDHARISSNIDSRGRLTVEAPRRYSAVTGRDRVIPIEGASQRSHSSSHHVRESSYTSKSGRH
ncbi:hypothetical protein Y032_0472g2070 [Ancylostoma ceylanicum]|uniref:SHSP domain-containing protein n=2 Tax=Ancylostoma ceylanicum TaxID=53326 RepID=A0A016WYM6_9BILA|nr:hypothetical protein Y032_0472g2070 [Ancylostoma ceylanicum]